MLWQPPLDGTSRLERFAATAAGAPGGSYEALWEWSVTDLPAFWSAVWTCFHVTAEPPGTVLDDTSVRSPGWFPEARLNYAELSLRMPGRSPEETVVVAHSQARGRTALTAGELRTAVAGAQRGLRAAGVERGDRVAAYAPNVPETLILMLAAAGLGAVFTSCSPEFGASSVLDRWSQIAPKAALVVDGYVYGEKRIDRRSTVDEITKGTDSITTTIWLPYLDAEAPPPPGAVTWDEFTSVNTNERDNANANTSESADADAPLTFAELPFDAPLYVLFSSGTTGLPKPIIHGHGGVALEHLKLHGLHHDLGPKDRFFWYSTTGWVMWNLLVSGLLTGSSVVLFDGDPMYPGPAALWELAAEERVTYFGTSAPFLIRAVSEPQARTVIRELESIRAVGSTGAPLPAHVYAALYDLIPHPFILNSTSGGTDVCSAFIGSAPTVSVRAGEMSCRLLGCAVDSFDDNGRSVRGRLGELVITKPMPSMPVGFWNDPDGLRYHSAYFSTFENVWRHGDWISISDQGTCTITGRSDATLNRGGVRMGTAEFYAIVDEVPGVGDSLVVHLENGDDAMGRLILFVQPEVATPSSDDASLHARIRGALRTELSPRHVPDLIIDVPVLPRTLTGKRLEVPVKRILLGEEPDRVVSPGALDKPRSIEEFVGILRSTVSEGDRR